MSRTPTVLGPIDAARALSVLAPLVAQGAIVRRPAVTAWAERSQADLRGSRILAGLRQSTGGGPAVVDLPGRTLAFVLDPADVARVLDGTPAPFRADTREKRAALGKFQPEAVLVSPPSRRGARRAANVAALEPRSVQHSLGDTFDAIVDRAVEETATRALATGSLTWPTFTRGFESAFRGVTLGEQAFHDTELTARLTSLRAAGNWAFFTTDRPREREAFTAHLAALVEAAPDDSLAGQLRARSFGVAAHGQVPHWLFAFDAAGAATYRALAVAAARPALAHALIAEAGLPATARLVARGSVLESVRLWPTTLVVLRESSEVTAWGDGELPERTSLVIVSSFFHRDSHRVPFAHAFEPEVWNDGRAEADRALVPFSTGPAGCPGRDVVAAVAGRFLARTIEALELASPRLRHLAHDPVPWTFDHAGLELTAARRTSPAPTTTTTRSDEGVS
jgi:cytochrome P450